MNEVFKVLNKYYGYNTFRKGQYEIISNILRGRDSFCILPTGGGKSICYQIPALLFKGITIVISPLISLMKDQVDNLNSNGINARYINSTQRLELSDEIIELCKNKSEQINILDIGTGSGAITVSLAKYIENSKVMSFDISDIPLEVGKINAINNEVDNKIEFVKSDVFSAIKDTEKQFDVIVSNPPYIPKKDIETLHTQVKDYEPYNALEGGEDGLDFYRQITKESIDYLKQGGILAYEVGHDQAEDVSEIMKSYGYTKIYKKKDIQGIDRVVIGFKL